MAAWDHLTVTMGPIAQILQLLEAGLIVKLRAEI